MARIFWVDSSVVGVVMCSSWMAGYLASKAWVIGSSQRLTASWLFDMTRRILVRLPEAAGARAARAEPVALVVVEVLTDDGLTGVGTVGGFCGAAVPIVRGHLRELLLGEDPRDVERHWETMYRATLRYGGRGAAIEALSGVD